MVGILDIGSNSVRFVVYEPPYIGEIPVFNEKVQCGLGRDLDATGKLSPEGKKSAIDALIGFRAIAKAMGVKRIEVIGTAALRDAKDGTKFAQTIAEKTGFKTRIISGEEEAHYSALGVTSYFPDAQGVVGDMGGGSLELANISQKTISDEYSGLLGALRVKAQRDKRAYAQKHFKDIPEALKNKKNFYAIGGTWRTLAQMYLSLNKKSQLPVRGFKVSAEKISEFAAEISARKSVSLIRDFHIEQKRADLLPYSALLLSELLPYLGTKYVVFSDTSIREGVLLDILKKAKKP